LAATEGGPAAGASVDVGTSDGVARAFTAETSANWLTVVPSAGTTPAQGSLTAATDLPVDTRQTEVVLTAADLPSATGPVTSTFETASLGGFTGLYSHQRRRTNPPPRAGPEVSGSFYPLLAPTPDVTSTSWWLDDPDMGGAPVRTASTAPYDFGPGS